jgi:hypothetical protein
MRAGNVNVTALGAVTGTGLLKAIVAQLVAINGAPETNAEVFDEKLAALSAAHVPPIVPPVTRSPADRAAFVEAERASDATGSAYLAQGIIDYLRPSVVIPSDDRDFDFDPSSTCVLYIPSGLFTATRTVRVVASDSFTDGDFVLIRNDGAQSLDATWQPPTPQFSRVVPTPVSLTTVASSQWCFAMQIMGAWRVLAGS